LGHHHIRRSRKSTSYWTDLQSKKGVTTDGFEPSGAKPLGGCLSTLRDEPRAENIDGEVRGGRKAGTQWVRSNKQG